MFFCFLCTLLVFVKRFFFLCIEDFSMFPPLLVLGLANFCSTWLIVSSRSHLLLVCILLAFPMLIYLTTVAPRYRLKLIAGNAIVFSEPDDIVSASSNSGISRSGSHVSVCGLLVPCPSLFGFGRFLILSITLWNSLFRSISFCVSVFTNPSILCNRNFFFFAIVRVRFSFVLLFVFSGGYTAFTILGYNGFCRVSLFLSIG